jgi:hypothetical protein
VHFFFKFFIAATLVLLGTLLGCYFSPGMRSWTLLYGMTTV